MWKGLFRKKGVSEADPALERLTLELAEIEEIAGKLFRRMEERTEALKALEARLDEKARRVESLVARAASIGAVNGDAVEARRRGVIALAQKGLNVDEIAEIFDMTKGEVELVLNLRRP
jgi:DNA-binding transcriptional regulator GbsR (MarR family)